MNSFGDEIKFDKNGDPAAMYDLVNWQLTNGKIEYVTIGKFDETATGKQKLQIQEQNIVWNGNQTKVGILTEQYSVLSIVNCRLTLTGHLKTHLYNLMQSII